MRIHISLKTSDLDRARSFYERLFGAPPSKTRSDYFNYRLDAPPLHLALTQTGQSEELKSGTSHYGIELNDHEQLKTWTQRLDQSDIAYRAQPNASCCYALGDKIWVSDPEGNEWEIWVRTGESTELADRETLCCTDQSAG